MKDIQPFILIDIDAKSRKEDLTDAEKHEVRRLVASFEAKHSALSRRLIAGL